MVEVRDRGALTGPPTALLQRSVESSSQSSRDSDPLDVIDTPAVFVAVALRAILTRDRVVEQDQAERIATS